MRTHIVLLILAAVAFGNTHARSKALDIKPLVKIAKRYKLPMPPDDARLVLADTGWTQAIGFSTGPDPRIYAPAYLLKDVHGTNASVLRGTELRALKPSCDGAPLWRPFSTNIIKPKPGGYVTKFSDLSTFVCAVQAAARGDNETAQAIWKRFSDSEYWLFTVFRDMSEKDMKNQKLLLGYCIFIHLRDELLEPDAEYDKIYADMTALFRKFPKLKKGWRAQLFNNLKISVKAKPAREDSVEALLLDWASRPSSMRHLGMFSSHTKEADAPAREIIYRGLDAVPELIGLLDDKRPTTHMQPGFMNAPPRILRVGDLARQLLISIAGDQISSQNCTDDREAIKTWWKTARTQDEYTVLTNGVFTVKRGKITGVNEALAYIIAKKYPGKLSELCDKFIENAHRNAHPYALYEAVAGSALPKDKRIRILSQCATQGSLKNKRCSLQNLAGLDDKACAVILLPIIKHLPKDAAEPYWICEEAAFTHVVMQIDDEEVWRAYLQAAKRSSIGLRMEMMNPMDYCYIGKKNIKRRLAFLAAFLDDDAVRELDGESGKFQGPCAGFRFSIVQVRNFAAMQIAAILKIKPMPDKFWTDEQWAELHHKVREHLQ